MPIVFQDSYQNNSPKPVDNKYGRFVNGVFRAYLTTAEANSLINTAYRYVGLTVLIRNDSQNGNVEYWYESDVTDEGLIMKGYIMYDTIGGTKYRLVVTDGAITLINI